MLFTAAGGAIGGNAIQALFFARFGVELLPIMYVIQGLFTFITSMAITGLMGRIPKQRLFVMLPFVIGFTLIAERLILPFEIKWFFAIIWLVMNVMGSLQGLLTWGLAGATCDTRQAKRLFPLFSAGGILGTVLGGLLTEPLAAWLHSENLLLVWAGALFIAFFLGRALMRNISIIAPTPSRARQVGVIAEMQRGYKFVRQSPIMQWVSYSAILFSVCFFSLALPFTRGATIQFPDADQLAGFLGLFQSATTILALLASLFFANRLFARFGIMPMLLIFPLIYLVGFSALAISAPFALLVAVRAAQMSWMDGIASTAWQALFNVVPSEQRDQVRAFVGGVPEQAGTLIAGLILVVGEQALQPQQLYFIGLVAAALLFYVIWRASQAYGSALVLALRAGQPQMFFREEQPFGGFGADAGAVAVAVKGMNDLDPVIRRVSVEILGNMSVPEATTALVEALMDGDAPVRVAALRGLARAQAAGALLEIAASLADPDPDVRYQAVDTLPQLARYPRGIAVYVEPLLADEDLLVRAHAALALLQGSDHPKARKMLHKMASDPRPLARVRALNALGECADVSAFDLTVAALEDGQPIVRKAAAGALAALHPQNAWPHLIRHLNDDEPFVRQALAEALGKVGSSALEPLLRALSNPSFEDGALMALEFLPAHRAAAQIRAHARAATQAALRYHSLALALSQKYGRAISGDGRSQLLIEALHDKGHRCGLNALRAVGLLKSRDAVAVAVENLRSREAAQRANALETLEAIGEREIVRPLLVLWEAGETASAPLPANWLADLLGDSYAWLRACAVLVAAGSEDPQILKILQTLAQSDPDEIVRAVAEKALSGEYTMDTLATLSLMERILFLRRVPMFADLPPADLKQVASIAGEAVFADGQALAHQGEAGDEMYIVISGEVRVLVAAGEQAEMRDVARRRSGDYVGEMAIISREPRSASLIADGAVRTLYIDQKQFESILRERPEISLAVMRVLCQRLREVTERSAN
jgi:HEAT repeat protein/ATP/ADP translocase